MNAGASASFEYVAVDRAGGKRCGTTTAATKAEGLCARSPGLGSPH